LAQRDRILAAIRADVDDRVDAVDAQRMDELLAELALLDRNGAQRPRSFSA
jgi:hypothetical protein